MHLVTVLKLLVLLLAANGTPVILKRLMGSRLALPLDGGARFRDGRPIFGPSKTLRGIVGAVVVTTAVAPLLGFDWRIGLLVALFAMAGDLFSSFTKRRFGLESGGMALGLDQIPESLLPFLATRGDLGLGAVDIVAGVIAFFVGELVLSQILFRLKVRDRPY
jgi:hypothetical protein